MISIVSVVPTPATPVDSTFMPPAVPAVAAIAAAVDLFVLSSCCLFSTIANVAAIISAASSAALAFSAAVIFVTGVVPGISCVPAAAFDTLVGDRLGALFGLDEVVGKERQQVRNNRNRCWTILPTIMGNGCICV